jgi:hypothetical protein
MAEAVADAERYWTLSNRVAKLCEETYSREPLLRADQCYPVAIIISVIRDRKSYREDFERENRALRRRRADVEKFKRLIKMQKQKFPILALPLPLRELEELEALLERTTPALLSPFDPLAGKRDKAWWHKAAHLIADRAESALVLAGHKKISKQKHGPFVKLVAGLLELATDSVFQPETVAHAIRKSSASELVG